MALIFGCWSLAFGHGTAEVPAKPVITRSNSETKRLTLKIEASTLVALLLDLLPACKSPGNACIIVEPLENRKEAH